MLTIWKFPVMESPADRPEIVMPAGARLLCVQTQFGQPHLWALVDPDRSQVRRGLLICGTGHPVAAEETAVYIGTVQVEGGRWVFHIFDRGELG